MAAMMAVHFLQVHSVSQLKQDSTDKQIKWPSLQNGGHFLLPKIRCSIEAAKENHLLKA